MLWTALYWQSLSISYLAIKIFPMLIRVSVGWTIVTILGSWRPYCGRLTHPWKRFLKRASRILGEMASFVERLCFPQYFLCVILFFALLHRFVTTGNSQCSIYSRIYRVIIIIVSHLRPEYNLIFYFSILFLISSKVLPPPPRTLARCTKHPTTTPSPLPLPDSNRVATPRLAGAEMGISKAVLKWG